MTSARCKVGLHWLGTKAEKAMPRNAVELWILARRKTGVDQQRALVLPDPVLGQLHDDWKKDTPP